MNGQGCWMYLIVIGIVLATIEVASYVTARVMLREGLIIGPPDTSSYSEAL